MSTIKTWSDVIGLNNNDKIRLNGMVYTIQRVIPGPIDSRGTYRTFQLYNNSNGNFEEIVIDSDGTIDSNNMPQTHLQSGSIQRLTGGKRKSRRNKRLRKNRRKTNRRR